MGEYQIIEFTNIVLVSLFMFELFYISRNMKFDTNDIEVLKIVDKLNITAAEYQGSFIQYTNKSITNNLNNNNDINSNSNQNKWSNIRIHFIEACLALSRFAIAKTQNISFNNLALKLLMISLKIC